MNRRNWMASTMLAAGLLLTTVGLPGMTAVAQDLGTSSAKLGDQSVSDSLARAELVKLYALYASLAPNAFVPPACVAGSEMFDDVPASSLFCPWIEELARRGITSGCSPTEYCPAAPVNRAQMAVFIVKAQAFIPERSLHVAGSALKPRGNDVSWDSSVAGGCLFVSSGSQNTVFNTPVSLPQGATVDTLRMYFNDTSASDSIAWFTAYTSDGAIFDEWSVFTTGSAGAGTSDSAPINHVIDNETFSYLLNWRPAVTGPTMQLCGLQIFYGG